MRSAGFRYPISGGPAPDHIEHELGDSRGQHGAGQVIGIMYESCNRRCDMAKYLIRSHYTVEGLKGLIQEGATVRREVETNHGTHEVS